MKKSLLIAVLAAVAASAFSGDEYYPTGNNNLQTGTPLPATLSEQPPAAKPSILVRMKDNTLAAFKRHAEEPLFTSSELTLEGAGVWTSAEPEGFTHIMEHSIRNGKVGAEMAFTYFMTRNFGAGVELGIYDVRNLGSMVFDSTTATVTGRLPLGHDGWASHIAPYLTIGVGNNFHDGAYSFQAGPGLEYRFTSHFGLFTEARYVWKDGPDALQGRAGLRFAFR